MNQGESINKITLAQKLKSYKKRPFSLIIMLLTCFSAVITAAIALIIVAYILIKGIPNLTPALFEWEYNSENVSMMPAVINTLTMIFLTLLMAVPIGVFSAVYLTEYAKRSNRLVRLIRTTTETLSGIPSIVYGLFGFLIFVIALKLGNSILSGALTLAIMVLPTIMRTTEEALLSVPLNFREASFGLGAGKLRTIFKIVLPSAMSGIISGVILSIGRIVGETAALIYTAGTVAGIPDSFLKSGRTLSVHLYALLNEGLYTEQAYATAVVLLIFVLIINLFSTLIASKLSANKGEKK